MKNKIINLIAGLFMLAMLTITLLACGYANNGDFSKATILIPIEMIACAIAYGIARHNFLTDLKAERKKIINKKRSDLRAAAEKEDKIRREAYRNATFDFVNTDEYEDSNKVSGFSDPLEEIKITLLCKNAMSRYNRNISR